MTIVVGCESVLLCYSPEQWEGGWLYPIVSGCEAHIGGLTRLVDTLLRGLNENTGIGDTFKYQLVLKWKLYLLSFKRKVRGTIE